ncbi:MAG: photosystem II reaction center protein Psb28 [Elainellaceae cyanobacterium]
MTLPTIEFFEGIPEDLSGVSLRRDRATGAQFVVMTFEQLKSIERFQSFTSRFNKALCLTDEEGRIEIEPDSVKFIFAGDEGDELKRVECRFELVREEHWERFMRFMNRYAEANGMEYQGKETKREN